MYTIDILKSAWPKNEHQPVRYLSVRETRIQDKEL